MMRWQEFNSGMERAKRDHLKCIQYRRKFWHDIKRMLRQARRGQLQDDILLRLIDNLDAMHDVEITCKAEYHRLLQNFKKSAHLNRSYADFADLILNDESQKLRYLRAASAIDGEGVHEDDSDHEPASTEFNMSRGRGLPMLVQPPMRSASRPGSVASGSSANETARMKVLRQIRNTLPFVLGEPMMLMSSLTLQTKAALIFIGLLATVGFGLLEFVLFRDQVGSASRQQSHVQN